MSTSQIKRKAVINGLQTLLTILVVFCLIALLVLVLITLNQGNKSLRELKHFDQLIADCTTPKGQCYQRSEQQRRQNVDEIKQIAVQSILCARMPGTDTEAGMEACIARNIN
jgi:predicted PurR-regulated permease PerM